MTPTDQCEMPELPEAAILTTRGTEAYTAAQMHTYAQAHAAQQVAAERRRWEGLVEKWREDAAEYGKIGCVGLESIKLDCADQLEAALSQAEQAKGTKE